MSVGLVPTMGALHEGHRSLLHRAVEECDRVVASIFVNPAQFGAAEDLGRYPRNLPADIEMLEAEGVDALLGPTVEAMYPAGFATSVAVAGPLASTLEGTARPGHFEGVAIVVTKLLVAARADRAYFGAKDAQQCAVVRRLAADLDIGTDIVVCATVRDHDGLAMSSRNAYLSPDQRQQALAIPRGMAAAAGAFAAGLDDSAALLALVGDTLAASPALRPEYVAIVDPDTFEPVARARPGSKILVAGRIGTARLIDTLSLGIDAPPDTPTVAGGSEPGVAERSRPCTVP